MIEKTLQLVNNLAPKIRNLPEIKRYKLAEEQLKKSDTVNQLIDKIKKTQKELVHAKHYNKTKHIEELETKLKNLNNHFDTLPIITEYQRLQVIVNDTLQIIQKNIIDKLSVLLEIEKPTKQEKGCGSGSSCGCK